MTTSLQTYNATCRAVIASRAGDRDTFLLESERALEVIGVTDQLCERGSITLWLARAAAALGDHGRSHAWVQSALADFRRKGNRPMARELEAELHETG